MGAIYLIISYLQEICFIILLHEKGWHDAPTKQRDEGARTPLGCGQGRAGSRRRTVCGHCAICRSSGDGRLRQLSHSANQRGDTLAVGDRLGGVAAMLEGIPIALRSARGKAAVHPAFPVRHRRRLARPPAPCPRPTPLAAMHGQFALHGVDPPISLAPHPPVY